jgi:ADP-ribosyl-[dinitrogen reductase] hydrolase
VPLTSASDPLRIDAVSVPGGGAIGMTLCPGKRQQGALTGDCARDLDADLAALRAWGAGVLLTLLETHELVALGVTELPARAVAAGLEWHHLPVPDQGVPGQEFDFVWHDLGPALVARLAAGERIVVHCKGGLGRTGTVAARLLVESGEAPFAAINRVREARANAIESVRQESYILGLAAA